MLDLKSSSEQIFFRKLSLGTPVSSSVPRLFLDLFAFFALLTVWTNEQVPLKNFANIQKNSSINNIVEKNKNNGPFSWNQPATVLFYFIERNSPISGFCLEYQ